MNRIPFTCLALILMATLGCNKPKSPPTPTPVVSGAVSSDAGGAGNAVIWSRMLSHRSR